MRVNGWQKPFDKLQVVTWVVFPMLIAGFYLFFLPFLASLAAAVAIGLIYGVLCLLVSYFVYQCTALDPTDSNILRSQSETVNASVSEDQIYCNVCMQFVHKNSRHCRVCDKCVGTFDHHCKWLNNCIGEKNYRQFLATIFFTLLLSICQFGVGLYLLIISFVSPSDIVRNSLDSYGCSGDCIEKNPSFPRYAIIGVHFAYLVISGPCLVLIVQLFLFHLKLCHRGITTYEYIVQKRKLKLALRRNLLSDGNASRSGFSMVESSCSCNEKSKNKFRAPGSSNNDYKEHIDAKKDGISTNSNGDGNNIDKGKSNRKTPSRGFGKQFLLHNNSTEEKENHDSVCSPTVNVDETIESEYQCLASPFASSSVESFHTISVIEHYENVVEPNGGVGNSTPQSRLSGFV